MRAKRSKEKAMAKRDERAPGTDYVGEECLLHVYWTGRKPNGTGQDHHTMRGRVSADLGLNRIPDPPFTEREMQDIMWGAKRAAWNVLVARRRAQFASNEEAFERAVTDKQRTAGERRVVRRQR